MRNRGFILLLLIWTVFASCSQKLNPQQESSLSVVDGELMMVGEVQYQDILDQFPEWRAVHQKAEINKKVIERLKEIEAPLNIKCFIGTWCSDSRYEVPRFMKALNLAKNPNIDIELIAVDRQKYDPQHLALKNDIDRVPTFIVERDGMELFRMIEFPDKTFTKDLLNELAKTKG